MLRYIKKYIDKGYSIFPVRHDKKPFFSWEKYQHEKPTQRELNEWWGKNGKYLDSNIAIVTGRISNLTVVDIDSEKGQREITQYVPTEIKTPIVKTPRGGYHLYFDYEEQVRNKTQFLTDCDIRSEGGYVLAPPSANGSGTQYTFVRENNLHTVKMPSTLFHILIIGGDYKGGGKTLPPQKMRSSPARNLSFQKGSRDETLFHIANHLVKGHMPTEEIEQILTLIGSSICDPPFPKREIASKIKSAMQRADRRERNLMTEVREFVLSTNGHFLSTDVHKWTQVSTRREKKTVSECLRRLVDEDIIERTGTRNGQFRLIDKEAPTIDYKKSFKDEDIELVLPLGIHRWIQVYPKSLFVFAGAPDSGKTALMLNVVRLNQKTMPTYYFSSEMGEQELHNRIIKFEDISIDQWNFIAKERATNFSDIIEPDALNIIDFLEITDNFYRISGELTAIFNRLKKGVAIVCIQKAPGAKLGRGASFSLEKPRLYCTVDKGKLRIVKAKNWRNSKENPNNQAIDFNIVKGCEIVPASRWYYDEDDI